MEYEQIKKIAENYFIKVNTPCRLITFILNKESEKCYEFVGEYQCKRRIIIKVICICKSNGKIAIMKNYK